MPKRADWSLVNRRILVVGPSGSGKSSWLEVYLAGLTTGTRIAAFDQKGEMSRRYRLPAWSAPSLAGRALAINSAFNPHVDFSDVDQAFRLWCWWVWQAAQILPGRCLVVIDELQDFVRPGPHGVPAGLRRLLTSGRGYEVDVVCLAQASNEVAARLRGQFNEIVAFATTEPRAIEMLRQFGLDPDQIRKLPRLHFVHRSRDTGGERLGKITFGPDRRARIEPAVVPAAPAAP